MTTNDYDMVPRTLGAEEAAEDTDALQRSGTAHLSVGLTPEPWKTSTAQTNAAFWSATIQGDIGRARAHREVTVRKVTLVVALLLQRSVTAQVWKAVLGLVVYRSLYARPALAFLEVVFHEADADQPGVVFVLSRLLLSSRLG